MTEKFLTRQKDIYGNYDLPLRCWVILIFFYNLVVSYEINQLGNNHETFEIK